MRVCFLFGTSQICVTRDHRCKMAPQERRTCRNIRSYRHHILGSPQVPKGHRVQPNQKVQRSVSLFTSGHLSVRLIGEPEKWHSIFSDDSPPPAHTRTHTGHTLPSSYHNRILLSSKTGFWHVEAGQGQEKWQNTRQEGDTISQPTDNRTVLVLACLVYKNHISIIPCTTGGHIFIWRNKKGQR